MSLLYKNYSIVTGVGKGATALSAFDNALMNSGIGDYNLVKVSSILPPKCQQKETIEVKKGSILHIAYASITTKSNEHLCSTIGVAIPKNDCLSGVIMEYSNKTLSSTEDLKEECENTIISMLKESFYNRKREYSNLRFISSTTKADTNNYYCTFSGIALW